LKLKEDQSLKGKREEKQAEIKLEFLKGKTGANFQILNELRR
jgi:hypothetical protein